MDVSSFYTTSAAQERKDTTVVAKNAGAISGASFLDFILAHLTEVQETSEQALLDQKNDLVEMLPVDEGVRKDMEGWMFGVDAKLSQTLALNQKSLENAVKPIDGTIIVDGEVKSEPPAILQSMMIETRGQVLDTNAAMAKLKAILAKLQSLSNGEGGGLALTNLTPAQITDLQNKIQALLNEDVNAALSEEQKKKALEGIYLGLIQLLSPSQQSQMAAIQASIDGKKADMTAQVNKLAKPQSPWAEAPLEGETTTDSIDKFSDVLKDFSRKNPTGGGTDELFAKATVKPDLSTLQGWPFNVAGSIFAPMTLDIDTYGGASPALPVTSLGTLTNLVTQAHSASQPHPATQMVVAAVSKAANSGETKNITLQLDPPELGRVEVRMTFGKDKTVKTTIVTEKPETFHMLQRDAHSLERALTDAGLSTDGSSLGFELAHEGYQFNQQNHQNGSNGYASNDDGVEDIIQSTMTWHVDPDTGHMRYNILA